MVDENTRKLEDMTKDEVIQYYKALAEGYQALAEALFAQCAESVIISGEGLAALGKSVEAAGGKHNTGLDKLRDTAVRALEKSFPQIAKLPKEQQLQALHHIASGKIL